MAQPRSRKEQGEAFAKSVGVDWTREPRHEISAKKLRLFAEHEGASMIRAHTTLLDGGEGERTDASIQVEYSTRETQPPTNGAERMVCNAQHPSNRANVQLQYESQPPTTRAERMMFDAQHP